MGLLGFDREREWPRRVPFGEKSNNSDRGSTDCFDLVGVDAWSIGCVDVRFSGVAERGVRGDNPGSELADLTGVREVWFAGDLDDSVLDAEINDEDGRVGDLECSSERG